MMSAAKIRNLPLFYYALVLAYGGAIVIALYDWQYMFIPLIILVLLCITAPFAVTISFYLPITVRGTKPGIALTFDDGPDEALTPKILQLLQKHKIKAAFFVTGKRASQHPNIIRAIQKHGHIIGNHTYSHPPLLMLQSIPKLYIEISTAADHLKTYGITPNYFRPPAGITNPRLGAVLATLNLLCVNFSCRAYDRGNRNIQDLSKKILRKVKPRDIILLHDISHPTMDIDYYLNELELLIKGLQQKGLTIYPLDEFIQ